MRIQSKNTTVVYAGQEILGPGQCIDAADYGFGRDFTTRAEPVILAEAPVIMASGNAQGAFNLPVCIDFASDDAAFKEALQRTAFVEENQTGELELTIDEVAQKWEAGIQRIDGKITHLPNCVRLTVTYDFLLGKKITTATPG